MTICGQKHFFVANLRNACVMKRSLLLVAALFAAACVQAQSDSKPAPTVKPQAVQPKPEDVSSMDAIIKATYDVISGPIGQKRDWDRFRSLFVPNARMGAAVRLKSGEIRYFGFDVERYVTMDAPIMEQKGFFERELKRHADTFGNISQVFSSYESRWKSTDDKPFERGINSFQLMNDGKRWWIVSIYWQGEDDKLKLPSKYAK